METRYEQQQQQRPPQHQARQPGREREMQPRPIYIRDDYRGSKQLLDYSATKGAIVAFTRSLALSLVNRESA